MGCNFEGCLLGCTPPVVFRGRRRVVYARIWRTMMFRIFALAVLRMRLGPKHLWPDISCTNSVDSGRNWCLNWGRLMKNNRGLKRIAGAAVVAASAAMGTMGAGEAKAGIITVNASGTIPTPYNYAGSNVILTATFADDLVDTDSSSNGFYTDLSGQVVVNGLPGGAQTWTGVNIYILDGATQDDLIIQNTGNNSDVHFWGPSTWFSGDSLLNLSAVNDVLSLTNNNGWGNNGFAGQIDGFGYLAPVNDASVVVPEPGTSAVLGLAAISLAALGRKRRIHAPLRPGVTL